MDGLFVLFDNVDTFLICVLLLLTQNSAARNFSNMESSSLNFSLLIDNLSKTISFYYPVGSLVEQVKG